MKIATLALALAGAAAVAGCGDDGDVHHHGDGGGDDAATLAWTAEPAATQAAGTALQASFSVHTEGDVHVTELRACEGAGVADCGLGGTDSFDLSAPAPADGDVYTGSLTLETPGEWTVVGYAHVGANPHTTAGVTVSVE